MSQKSDLYHLQYDVKKMSKQTRAFIGLSDSTISAGFTASLQNDYIPRALKMVSTCTPLVGAQDILLDAPTEFTLGRTEAYNEHLEVFAERPTESVHFTSVEEC